MKRILKSYLKRLTNLTARNRSLVLLRLPQRQFFDIHALDFLLNKPSFSIVEQLLERQPFIPLCDVIDPRNERVNERSKQLGQLARTEKLIIEERGAEDLYVGYPIVKGKFLDGTVVRCPLLLFPVSLVVKIIQKKNQWCLEKRDAEVVFNRSFLLAYAHFNNVKILDEWLEFSFEEFPKDNLDFRTTLYETLKDTPLEINFNQELFKNQLIDFKEFKKQELEGEERNGELKLFPQAVIGIFPQTGSFMAADYEKLLQETVDSPADFSSFFGGKELRENRPIREQELLLPLATDASQEAAIKQAKMGRSLVVEGPPGTGKSQLIGNIIADFTARNKRVLVVCQKRAALDTVYNRLETIGLAPFMALLHDFKNDRKTLFSNISKQIENINIYEQKNNSLDTILLERSFDQACRDIERTTRELDELKLALFDSSIAGQSIKEMYLRLAHFKKEVIESNLLEIYHFFRMDKLDNYLKKIQQFEQYQQHLATTNKATEFWIKRHSAKAWSFTHLQLLSKAIQDTKATFLNFESETNKLLEKRLKLLDLPANFSENITEINALLGDEETHSYFTEFHNNTYWKAHELPLSELKAKKDALLEIMPVGISSAFMYNPHNETVITIILDAITVMPSFIGRLKWLYFSKYRKQWKQLSKDFDLKFEFEELSKFIKEIETTQRFCSIQTFLKSYDILVEDNVEKAVHKLNKILLSKEAFEKTLPVFKNSKLTSEIDFLTFETTSKLLQKLEAESKQNVEAIAELLTAEQVVFLEKTNDVNPLIDYLEKSFDYIIENDQLVASFSAKEQELLEIISEDTPTGISLVAQVEYSLLKHWIAHIETQYPVLRGVSTLKIKQLEVDLQTSIQRKQALCQNIVLMRLRETTYKRLEKNRLGNITTYRELGHQVTKKKQLWSVRKIIENFADELYDLIPCWLASPETVSAIFPLENPPFDLVIFDEASQCYIEHGLPAALRGKQVIIAGDSQQLQPSDLYQIRYDEETEGDELLLEIDSLLDVALQYLPQSQLRGHYRSKTLDLIAFSNKHFYKNTLHLLPDYQQINNKKPNINYLKTTGVWENNRNQSEAEKVIEIIQTIGTEKQIGVVTFNYKQADLIDNLLGNGVPNRTNVRVKNIENIQGDEYDIVIFSIGYAPNKSGKLLMNFGTLNQQGGENRLNVAVTRAREEIYVVASILPQELNVENSQNNGPKLLQNYLQFAFEVSENRFVPTPYESTDFSAKNTLKNELLKKTQPAGYKLVELLPFADLTVIKDERYDSLILTDDGHYFDSKSSKEIHGYLPLLFQQKGWQFERRWSRNAGE